MTRDSLKDLVFIEIRKIFPELMGWYDLVRFRRMQDATWTADDNLMLDNEYDMVVNNTLRLYGLKTKRYKGEVQFNTDRDRIPYEDLGILSVDEVARGGVSDTGPTTRLIKVIDPVSRWSVDDKCYGRWRNRFLVGEATHWYDEGNQILIIHPPEREHRFFIYGVRTPYFDVAHGEVLRGVSIEDEMSLARYIAGELIEAFQPQLGIQWKLEAERQWERSAIRTGWDKVRNSTRRRDLSGW